MYRQDFLYYVGQTSPFPDGFEVNRAEGIYLYDISGNAYIDGISGIAVSSFGHRHPKINAAICTQLDAYMHTMVYGEHIQKPQVALAKKIAEHLPEELSNVFFVNSGAEAVEGAIKLARKFTGRKQIIACRNAYHGSTLAAESLRSDEVHLDAYPPVLQDVLHLNFNSHEDIQKITADCACVIIEPIQGEAGVIEGNAEYMQALRKQCTQAGSLLIFDCIQTGLGRTGTLWGYESYGIQPDVVLLGKALGAGLPLAAFVSKKHTMQSLSQEPILGHMSTYGGNPVCCAAGFAAMEMVTESGFLESVNHKGELLKQTISAKTHKVIPEGKGLMLALRLQDPERLQEFISRCREEGVLLDWFLFNNRSIRLYPPLTITEEQCQVLAEKIIRAVERD